MTDEPYVPGRVYPEPDHTMPQPQGWMVEPLTLATTDARVVDALVPHPDGPFGGRELAVHRMVEWDGLDDGWTVATVQGGYRISYDGLVFARCLDAITIAEDMMHAWDGWQKWASGTIALPPHVQSWMKINWSIAREDNQFLNIHVLPGL